MSYPDIVTLVLDAAKETREDMLADEPVFALDKTNRRVLPPLRAVSDSEQ